MNRMKTIAAGLTAAVLTLGLSACGQSQEDKEAKACDAIAELRTTLQETSANLDAQSTVEQWRDARSQVSQQIEKVEDTVEDANEAAWDQLDDAWDRFEDAVQDVDRDATIPQAGASLVEDFQALQAARDEAAQGLTCS